MIVTTQRKTVRLSAEVEVRKYRKNVTVSWGSAEGHGQSESEALSDLAKSTGEFLAESLFPKYRWANGALFVLYRHPCGFAYDIIRLGSNNASTCLMSATNEREALETMERHVAQEIGDGNAAD